MTVTAIVISKWKAPWGLDVEVSYTCPHCGETVTETISFSKDFENGNYVACLDDHECYECGEYIDLEVDLY